FSSRRRHTRFSRDWSSYVCSSDLRSLDVGRLARAVIALLPSWARAWTPVAEHSHARAQPVDRDPVRPWHDPSDLTYVDFVRSAMYQFDISARHLVGHPTTW